MAPRPDLEDLSVEKAYLFSGLDTSANDDICRGMRGFNRNLDKLTQQLILWFKNSYASEYKRKKREIDYKFQCEQDAKERLRYRQEHSS